MSDYRNVNTFYFMRLGFTYLSRKLNLQIILFISVFLSFVIGDSLTASMMMENKGINAEYNMIVRNVFIDFGLPGLIAVKFFFILVPLILSSIDDKKNYWFMNGVLISLTVIGLLATRANLQELAGLDHNAPMEINLLYIMILFVLTITGMIIDSYLLDMSRRKYLQ